ncbi:MAG: hypothetical protein ACE5GA_08295, partial [Candidatus Zixiibacteriota bacterium]
VDLIFKKKLRTELSTLDDFRVAAREEIAGYSEALGAKLIDPQETSDRSRVTEHDIAPVTLVDCHSNIYDQTRYMELVKQVTALRPAVTFLTISALTRSSDLSRILKRFKPLNPTHLIVTHTDLTEAVGGVYTTLVDLDLQLAALTNAPGSLGEILTPDPGSMAHRIFRRSQ